MSEDNFSPLSEEDTPHEFGVTLSDDDFEMNQGSLLNAHFESAGAKDYGGGSSRKQQVQVSHRYDPSKEERSATCFYLVVYCILFLLIVLTVSHVQVPAFMIGLLSFFCICTSSKRRWNFLLWVIFFLSVYNLVSFFVTNFVVVMVPVVILLLCFGAICLIMIPVAIMLALYFITRCVG